MKNKIKIFLIPCFLIASVGLFAQAQHNVNLINKYFPLGVNKRTGNNSNHLGKNNYKVRLDSLTYVSWDLVNNKYDNEKRAVQKFYYDSNGNNSLFILLGYDYTLEKVIDTYRIYNTFNSNNNPILEMVSTVDCNDNTKWVNSRKIETNYDINNNKTVFKKYSLNLDSTSWDLFHSIYYSYDNNNYVVNEIDSTLINSNWYLKKRVYSYDNKGNISSHINFNWENGNWVNEEKFEFNYDLAKKTIESINSAWFGDWNIREKTVVQTDANGETISITRYSFLGGVWNPYLRYLIEYNVSFKIEEIAWPHVSSFGNISSNYQLLTYKMEEFVNNEWKNSGLETFYYSSLFGNTSTNELTETNINIYPNPSTGVININTNETIENINILDINGKLVHHQTNNSPFDLSQHAKGIYFINITTEKVVINKKIVLN